MLGAAPSGAASAVDVHLAQPSADGTTIYVLCPFICDSVQHAATTMVFAGCKIWSALLFVNSWYCVNTGLIVTAGLSNYRIGPHRTTDVTALRYSFNP